MTLAGSEGLSSQRRDALNPGSEERLAGLTDEGRTAEQLHADRARQHIVDCWSAMKMFRNP